MFNFARRLMPFRRQVSADAVVGNDTEPDPSHSAHSSFLSRLKPENQRASCSSEDVSSEDDRDMPDMGQLLRESMVPASEGQRFLPLDKLWEIVCPEAIRRELQIRLKLCPAELHRIANEICDSDDHREGGEIMRISTSRRRLFAVLVLINEVERILLLIAEGLSDRDLPLALSNMSSQGRSYQILTRGQDSTPVRAFQTLQVMKVDLFYAQQWSMLAPFFQIADSDKSQVVHYKLDPRTTLPFIQGGKFDFENHARGGFSNVWKVKIHPAHHDFRGEDLVVSDPSTG